MLFKYGYCRDEKENEEENCKSGRHGIDWREGTGIGEGEGVNDVSKEIEDESQLDGLRNEEEWNNEKNDENSKKDNNDGKEGGEEEDNSIEVSMDFNATSERSKQREENESEFFINRQLEQ